MNRAQTMHTVQADRVAPQPWRNGGGQTRELLAWPDTTHWQLRISRADIEASGPFSAFADVQRWFVVLSGKGLVLHLPTADQHTLDHVLLPGHIPLHFDGGLAPGCTLLDGPTQDLNLMARGGQAGMLAAEAGVPWRAHFAQCGIYTARSGVCSTGHRRYHLAAHSLLWLTPAPATALRFRADDAGPGADPDTDIEAAAGADVPCAWWLGFTPQASAPEPLTPETSPCHTP